MFFRKAMTIGHGEETCISRTDGNMRRASVHYRLKKRYINCKKGYFRKNKPWNQSGNRTVAAAETTSEEEEKRCAVHKSNAKKTFKNGRLQPRERCPRDPLFSAVTFRWRVLSRAGRNRAAANCRESRSRGWSLSHRKVHTVWGAECINQCFIPPD